MDIHHRHLLELLGQRHGVDSDLNEVFLRTGTMHFLSVSGLHVGCFAAFVWWLCLLCNLGRRWGGLATLVAIVIFAVAVVVLIGTCVAAVVVSIGTCVAAVVVASCCDFS